MFKKRYQNKTVLVTGHTGFKGSWLSIWLKELGANVVGFSLEPPTEPSNFVATGLEKKICHVYGDIREYDRLSEVILKHQPEFVFHLAAQSLVRLSYEVPKRTFDTNLGGTVNILEVVRANSCVRALICVTSDKCYENKEHEHGYREDDPLGGHDPYSASKGCAELAYGAYFRSFFSLLSPPSRSLGTASVRAGNVFGGGDWGMDRIIPDCIRALSCGRPVGIRNPRSIRPWQHVLEPLSGYLWLGALLWEDPASYSGPWNLGPEEDSHLMTFEIVERFIRHWGEGSWRDLSVQNAPHEASLLKLNCDKAHVSLKWRAVLDIDEALGLTAEWYKGFINGWPGRDMYRTCLEQIRAYSERAALKSLPWTGD